MKEPKGGIFILWRGKKFFHSITIAKRIEQRIETHRTFEFAKLIIFIFDAFSCIHLIFLINLIIPSSSYHKSTLELKFTIIALKKKEKEKKIPTPGITYPIHIDDIQRRPVSKANHHRPTPPPPTDHSTFHKEC